jgi:hypothetical protein
MAGAVAVAVGERPLTHEGVIVTRDYPGRQYRYKQYAYQRLDRNRGALAQSHGLLCIISIVSNVNIPSNECQPETRSINGKAALRDLPTYRFHFPSAFLATYRVDSIFNHYEEVKQLDICWAYLHVQRAPTPCR